MLNIKELMVQYAGNQQPSVDKFNLTINKGEIVCIVGESGSGKSTVLKSILGALPKNVSVSGAISFHGHVLLKQTQKEWQKVRGSKVAMIFQDSSAALNPIRKIGKQYEEYILQHEKMSLKKARGIAEEMLMKMQLRNPTSVLDSYPHQLSGGMCQRVGIAMAMTFQPELLLADEPTSALDVVTQKKIVEELLFVRENFNTSILLVTHNVAMAAYMADRLIVMQKGKMVDQGDAMTVVEAPTSDYTKELLAAIPELERISYV